MMLRTKLISFNINEAAEPPKAEELLQELRGLNLESPDEVSAFAERVEELGVPMGRAFIERVVGRGRAREILEEYGDIKVTPADLWQAVQSLGGSAKLEALILEPIVRRLVRVLDRPA